MKPLGKVPLADRKLFVAKLEAAGKLEEYIRDNLPAFVLADNTIMRYAFGRAFGLIERNK